MVAIPPLPTRPRVSIRTQPTLTRPRASPDRSRLSLVAEVSWDQYDAAHAEGSALDLPGAVAVLIDLASTVHAAQPAGVAESGD